LLTIKTLIKRYVSNASYRLNHDNLSNAVHDSHQLKIMNITQWISPKQGLVPACIVPHARYVKDKIFHIWKLNTIKTKNGVDCFLYMLT